MGVSDHSMDPVLVPALATLMGATMIEKHITLSRGNDGLDDPIALEPEEFRRMVAEVTRIATALRNAGATDSLDYHRAWLMERDGIAERFGVARVEKVLGDGVKTLAPSEERNYGFTNRSIHARHDLRAGARLTPDVVAILRTEKNLTPGLHPRHWETILNRRLTRDVAAGEGLTWNHLLGD